jgi:hypothetical protein
MVFEHEAGQKNNPEAEPHIVTIFPMEKKLKQTNVVPSSIEQNTTKLSKGGRNESYELRKDGDCKPQDTVKKFDNDKDKDGGGVGLPSLTSQQGIPSVQQQVSNSGDGGKSGSSKDYQDHDAILEESEQKLKIMRTDC